MPIYSIAPDLLPSIYDGDRFDYSIPFLQWALTPPEYIRDWHVGVRNVKSNMLMGCITAVPVHVRIYDKVEKMAEINFLCVHKKLRSGLIMGRVAVLHTVVYELLSQNEALSTRFDKRDHSTGQPAQHLAGSVHRGGRSTEARGSMQILPSQPQPQEARGGLCFLLFFVLLLHYNRLHL